MRPLIRPSGVAKPALRGFTLIELLVAITVMALIAILSWRGIDGMVRTQEATRQRADDMLVLQASLAQWGADLDALAQQHGTPLFVYSRAAMLDALAARSSCHVTDLFIGRN